MLPALAAWVTIGGIVLFWMLRDPAVRADVASWPVAVRGGYFVFVVLAWPLLMFGD